MRYRVVMMALAVLLAGCASGTYRVPDTGVVSAEAVRDAYNVDAEWWQAYEDPQLDNVVDTALRNNIDYAQTAIAVNRALYQANQLGADLVPVFSSGGTASSTNDTTNGSPATRSFSGNLSVSYELDLWGRLRDAASAQEWEYKATAEDRENARLALINNTVKTYFNLLYLYQARGYTSQSLKFYENLFRITEARFKAGKSDGLEIATARQAVLSARNNLLDLENQSKTAEQTLRNLLNLRPEDRLPVEERDIMAISGGKVDLDVPIAALGLRPDIHAAEYRIQRMFKNQESIKESLYPSVTVGGSLSVTSREADTMFDVPFLAGTVKINLPFLQWNKLRWTIKVSETQFESAKLSFEQTVNTALNEVDAYYYAYQNARLSLSNITRKHEEDEKISSYRKIRYEAGTDELSDWIQAQNMANQSMLTVLRSQYTVLSYESAIYQALGGRLSEK